MSWKQRFGKEKDGKGSGPQFGSLTFAREKLVCMAIDPRFRRKRWLIDAVNDCAFELAAELEIFLVWRPGPRGCTLTKDAERAFSSTAAVDVSFPPW